MIVDFQFTSWLRRLWSVNCVCNALIKRGLRFRVIRLVQLMIVTQSFCFRSRLQSLDIVIDGIHIAEDDFAIVWHFNWGELLPWQGK